MEFVRYKRSRFSARFPKDYTYSRSHYWMTPVDGDSGLWRVGFTKFATRMLGELVDSEFDVAAGDGVEPGQEIGWVEGFKAASDVFCVVEGIFEGGNPALQEDACIIRADPYVDGWLYAVRGRPEPESMTVDEYVKLLDGTIDQMQAHMDTEER